MRLLSLIRREVRSLSRTRLGIAAGLMVFNLAASLIGYLVVMRNKDNVSSRELIEASKTVFVSAASLGSICAILLAMDSFERDKIKGVYYIILARATREDVARAKLIGTSGVIAAISFPTLAALALLPNEIGAGALTTLPVLLAASLTTQYLVLIGLVTNLYSVLLHGQAKVGIVAFVTTIVFDILQQIPVVNYLSPKTYLLQGIDLLISDKPKPVLSLINHFVFLAAGTALAWVLWGKFRRQDL